ncbi:hypothetical protein [Fluviicola sp.]|uniref:hypothetical protein n=1 Tax=Fluviicola sp. TaxID=1917219 RepID=UPI0031E2CE16
MKTTAFILSTFLYGALSLSMIQVEIPENQYTSLESSSTIQTGDAHATFLAQAPGGERRRVRRRTRRRVKRRVERRENATGQFYFLPGANNTWMA